MRTILDDFGKTLISEVRDRSISEIDMLLDGKMKGITAQIFKSKLKSFGKEQIEVIKWLIPQLVDINLNNTLEMIDSNNSIDVKITYNNSQYSIKELSDGLSGELYTSDGWIQKFSNERYEEL